MTDRSKVLIGVAGEYFVAAELSRRGYIASITLRNTDGVDILASNYDASRQVAIQVKTNQGNSRDWILNEKAGKPSPDNFFYAFVNLNQLNEPNEPYQRPDFFIVPSKIVVDHVTSTHADWLGKPGKQGQQHQNSSIRKFRFLDEEHAEKYRDNWDLLGISERL